MARKNKNKNISDIITDGIKLVIGANSCQDAVTELQGKGVVSDIILGKIQRGQGWEVIRDILKSDWITDELKDSINDNKFVVKVVHTSVDENK